MAAQLVLTLAQCYYAMIAILPLGKGIFILHGQNFNDYWPSNRRSKNLPESKIDRQYQNTLALIPSRYFQHIMTDAGSSVASYMTVMGYILCTHHMLFINKIFTSKRKIINLKVCTHPKCLLNYLLHTRHV